MKGLLQNTLEMVAAPSVCTHTLWSADLRVTKTGKAAFVDAGPEGELPCVCTLEED